MEMENLALREFIKENLVLFIPKKKVENIY